MLNTHVPAGHKIIMKMAEGLFFHQNDWKARM